MKYKLKHVLEYAAARAMVGLTNLLPYRAALGIGWLFAGLAFALAPSLRRTAAARIRQAFKDRFSDREIRRLSWLAWRNLCFNGVETMRVPRITRDWLKTVLDDRDAQVTFDNLKDGKGLIIAVPHMGNWELAGVAMQLLGAKIMIIVRRQKNPLTNAFLNRMREYTGIQAFLREQKSFAGLAHGLEEGKMLAILPDLRAKADFVPCRFLGHDGVQIPAGMAHFARESGVPIIPAYIVREGWARHRAVSFEPIRPDPSLSREADLQRMTQYVMDCFDKAIRAHPDQYFWFNKRWVLGET